MVQIQADFMDRGVQFLTINSNDVNKYPLDSFPKMKERAEEKGFNFPYLFEESKEVPRASNAERTQEVFLFDPLGLMQYHGTMDDNYDDPKTVEKQYLRDKLDATLSGNAQVVQQTSPFGCTIKWK